MTLFFATAYLALINIKAYRAFAADKQKAIDKEWRTPESTLLFWALTGGWPGAKIAQRRLRHKTYKQPFGRKLNRIPFYQAITVFIFIFTPAADLIKSYVPPAGALKGYVLTTLDDFQTERLFRAKHHTAPQPEKIFRPPVVRRVEW